jgi:hypothetical protein
MVQPAKMQAAIMAKSLRKPFDFGPFGKAQWLG